MHLGSLRTDEAGRLIVVPGDGHSFSLPYNGKPEQQPFQLDTFNNDDWVRPTALLLIIFHGSDSYAHSSTVCSTDTFMPR